MNADFEGEDFFLQFFARFLQLIPKGRSLHLIATGPLCSKWSQIWTKYLPSSGLGDRRIRDLLSFGSSGLGDRRFRDLLSFGSSGLGDRRILDLRSVTSSGLSDLGLLVLLSLLGLRTLLSSSMFWFEVNTIRFQDVGFDRIFAKPLQGDYTTMPFPLQICQR